MSEQLYWVHRAQGYSFIQHINEGQHPSNAFGNELAFPLSFYKKTVPDSGILLSVSLPNLLLPQEIPSVSLFLEDP